VFRLTITSSGEVLPKYMMEGWTIFDRVVSLLLNVVILMKRYSLSGQLITGVHFINVTTISKR
jgi:hypothetical protein